MTVYITFTSVGSDAGPFNLYSNVDGYISPFAVNVPKATLIAGYPSASVPDGTTIIRARSVGVCTNFVDLPIVPVGSTTTTTTLVSTTTTTTLPPTTTTTTTAVFTPFSYTGEVQSVSTGPAFQFTFQLRIDVSGAPAWNQIVGGTVTINQGTSGTNGITNILHVSGNIYQCNTTQGIVSNAGNATITLCGIGVSNGSTTHTHQFVVPITYTPTEIGNGVIKSVTVNVT